MKDFVIGLARSVRRSGFVKRASDSRVGDVDSSTRLHCSHRWYRVYRLDGLSVDHHWYPKQDEGLVARDSPERAGAR